MSWWVIWIPFEMKWKSTTLQKYAIGINGDLMRYRVQKSQRWRNRMTQIWIRHSLLIILVILYVSLQPEMMENWPNQTELVVHGAFGGNLGQEIANLHALFAFYKKERSQDHLNVILQGEYSLAMLLQPGSHKIVSATNLKCSLLPIGGRVDSVTTTGLKWNLGK